MTTLDPHRRGDTFSRSVPLAEGWEWEEFTGGVKFTLRSTIPPSDEETDTAAVDQATDDAGEITFNETTRMITVVIPASRSNSWERGKLYWDLEVRVTDAPHDRVYTLDAGDILIQADFTRSSPTEDS